jgi:ankyrin repeat protein
MTVPALVAAIRAGDVAAVTPLIAAEPRLAVEPLGGDQGGRTALHVVTDWPGFYPRAPEIVRVLVAAGADVNARFVGPTHAETPLHWAASSDDVEVGAALVELGADLDVPGGSIGTPLGNAVGYGCWQVARLLVARGAKVDVLWHAAGVGLRARVEELLAATPHTHDQISQAFWHACAGGQRRTAEALLAHGANASWMPPYAKRSALEVAGDPGTQRAGLIEWLRARGA